MVCGEFDFMMMLCEQSDQQPFLLQLAHEAWNSPLRYVGSEHMPHLLRWQEYGCRSALAIRSPSHSFCSGDGYLSHSLSAVLTDIGVGRALAFKFELRLVCVTAVGHARFRVRHPAKTNGSIWGPRCAKGVLKIRRAPNARAVSMLNMLNRFVRTRYVGTEKRLFTCVVAASKCTGSSWFGSLFTRAFSYHRFSFLFFHNKITTVKVMSIYSTPMVFFLPLFPCRYGTKCVVSACEA